MLFREFKITKEQWKRLSNWDIINWVLRPGKNDGETDPKKAYYWPLNRTNLDHPADKEIGWRRVFFDPKRIDVLKKPNKKYPDGATDEQLEEEFKRWIASLNA